MPVNQYRSIAVAVSPCRPNEVLAVLTQPDLLFLRGPASEELCLLLLVQHTVLSIHRQPSVSSVSWSQGAFHKDMSMISLREDALGLQAGLGYPVPDGVRSLFPKELLQPLMNTTLFSARPHTTVQVIATAGHSSLFHPQAMLNFV